MGSEFDFSIEDADVLFDKTSNNYLIYAIVNLNEYYYIIKIRIESNYRVTIQVIKDLNNLRRDDTIIFLFTKIKKAKIFLNKDLNEFYVILSYFSKESAMDLINQDFEKDGEKSFIYFYSQKNLNGEKVIYKKVSATIDGVVPNFVGNKSFLNILFNKSYLIELLFDVKTSELIYQDISHSFYRGIMIKNTFIKPTQNRMVDTSFNDNKSEIIENYNRPTFYGGIGGQRNQNLTRNECNFNDSVLIENILKENLGDRDKENRILNFLTNKLRKYYDFKIRSKEVDLNAIYDINIDIEELTNFLSSMVRQNNPNNSSYCDKIASIRPVINRIILNIIDNESLNINNINMDTKKSEYIIIDYLKERSEKYDIFLSFLKDYKIFENFDSNKELNSLCTLFSEKLKSAIKLREQENFLLKNYLVDTNINYINNPQQKLVNISYNFYNECFKNLKHKKEQIESTNINKYSVYLKISTFDDYLKYILGKFNDEVNDIHRKKEDNLYLAFNLVNLWNSIFDEIKNISYKNEIANNQLEIPRMKIDNEFNTNYNYTINAQYYEDFNNFRSSIWLIENKENFLDKLEKIFVFLVEDDKKEVISIRNNLSNFSKTIIDFVDNLIFFNRMHYNFKFSKEQKKIEFERKKRFLINKIIKFDYEKSLKIAIKYQSLFTISYICNLFKCPEKLKEYFDTIPKTIEGGKEIEYMLRVYLVLDMEKKIHSNKIIDNLNEISFNCRNKNKNDNYNEIIFYFDFFNVFEEYHAQVVNIVWKYPKVKFYFEYFFKSREGVYDRHFNIEKTTWEDFLDIEDLINAVINQKTLENVFKMTRFVLNMNMVSYQENTQSSNLNEENLNESNSDDYKNYINEQKKQKIKIFKLNSVIEKTNFYYMLYTFNVKLGLYKEQYTKFMCGPEKAYYNLKKICDLIEHEFSSSIKVKNFDYLKNNGTENIKMLLNLTNLFKNIYSIEDENENVLQIIKVNNFLFIYFYHNYKQLIKTVVDILIQIDFLYFLQNEIRVKILYYSHYIIEEY